MSEPKIDAEKIIAALEAERQATEGQTLVRYDHGGGRAAFFETNRLSADFYNEGDREAYWAALNAMPPIRALLLALPETECGGKFLRTDPRCGTCPSCILNEIKRRLNDGK